MRTRFKKLIAGLAALAALALGGAAISQATSNPPHKSPRPASATDRETGRDEGARDETSEKSEKPDGSEADGNEKAEGNEKPDANEKADDDGPSGHADESADSNADHQREGRE